MKFIIALLLALCVSAPAHAQVYDGLPGRLDRINPNAVIRVLPGVVHNIAEGDIFVLPQNAVKARFDGRLETPMVLNSTPKYVSRINPIPHRYCIRPEEPGTVIENRGTIKAVFDYPLPPAPPGCQGLQCLMGWPTASVSKNGGPAVPGAPFEIQGNALIYSFNISVVPTDTVDLIVSHQYGTVNFNPGNFSEGRYWKMGLVADMNCP